MPYPYRTIAETLARERGIGPLTHETFAELLATLRFYDSPLERATLLEDVAYATLHVFAQALPPTSPSRRALETAWCLARSFEDAEARLAIYTLTRVIHNDVWLTTGRLHDWVVVIQAIWASCAHYVASVHSDVPRSA